MNVLTMKNVKKSFGDVQVLRDISLTVDEGQVLAIIGPSGSGKSTLLRCATLLTEMTDGSLIYLGKAAAESKEPRGQSARLLAFQNISSEILPYKSYFSCCLRENIKSHFILLFSREHYFVNQSFSFIILIYAGLIILSVVTSSSIW